MDRTMTTEVCFLCRRPLLSDPFQAFTILEGAGSHNFCRDILAGYLSMRAAHNHHCHLKNCTKGPTNPFVLTEQALR